MPQQLDLSPLDATSSRTDSLETTKKMVNTTIDKRYILWDVLTDLLDRLFPNQWELEVPSQAVNQERKLGLLSTRPIVIKS